MPTKQVAGPGMSLVAVTSPQEPEGAPSEGSTRMHSQTMGNSQGHVERCVRWHRALRMPAFGGTPAVAGR
eukprot:250757-Chlamydomonas_euryale.AAC.25